METKRKVMVMNSMSKGSSSNVTSPSKPDLQTTLPSSGVMRPKARVNSSATTRKASTSVVSGTTRNNVSTTPRARSPLKQPLQSRSPQHSLTVKTIHVPATSAASFSPESRPLSRTAEEFSATGGKARHDSISLHHAVSFTSLHTRAFSTIPTSHPSTPIRDETGSSQASFRQGRVRAKVSAMAKQAEMSNSLPPSPTLPGRHRLRAPSISSSISLNSALASPPNPTFYPITTATPAANPHRYATTRTSPPTSARNHQPFSWNDGSAVVPKPDPIFISQSLHSPPNSAVSISSRSSVSRSSVSYRTETSEEGSSTLPSRALSARQPTRLESHGSGFDLATSELRLSLEDAHIEDQAKSEDRKIKAEAKSNRKIADLEITNRSLLAINASLETAKHRQAKEIRELRRKLRESRLILPPRTYRAVKLSANHDDSADEEDEEVGASEEEGTGDEVYNRIRILLEGLLETGRRALESKPKDFQEGGKGGTKVLSAEEVRSWRVLTCDPDIDHSHEDIEMGSSEGNDLQGTASPSHTALPDSSNDITSEEELEGSKGTHLIPT